MERGEISACQTLAEYALSGKERLHHHLAQPLRARPLRARYTVLSVDSPPAHGSYEAALLLRKLACSSEWVVCLESFRRRRFRGVRLANPPDAI